MSDFHPINIINLAGPAPDNGNLSEMVYFVSMIAVQCFYYTAYTIWFILSSSVWYSIRLVTRVFGLLLFHPILVAWKVFNVFHATVITPILYFSVIAGAIGVVAGVFVGACALVVQSLIPLQHSNQVRQLTMHAKHDATAAAAPTTTSSSSSKIATTATTDTTTNSDRSNEYKPLSSSQDGVPGFYEDEDGYYQTVRMPRRLSDTTIAEETEEEIEEGDAIDTYIKSSHVPRTTATRTYRNTTSFTQRPLHMRRQPLPVELAG